VKSMDTYDHSNNTHLPATPYMNAGDGASYRESSHVFKCMECDLQFQTDIATISRNASGEIDEGFVRIRLDPAITPQREE
jgi:hypothetical protein